jgi:hypothetical protein
LDSEEAEIVRLFDLEHARTCANNWASPFLFSGDRDSHATLPGITFLHALRSPGRQHERISNRSSGCSFENLPLYTTESDRQRQIGQVFFERLIR